MIITNKDKAKYRQAIKEKFPWRAKWVLNHAVWNADFVEKITNRGNLLISAKQDAGFILVENKLPDYLYIYATEVVKEEDFLNVMQDLVHKVKHLHPSFSLRVDVALDTSYEDEILFWESQGFRFIRRNNGYKNYVYDPPIKRRVEQDLIELSSSKIENATDVYHNICKIISILKSDLELGLYSINMMEIYFKTKLPYTIMNGFFVNRDYQKFCPLRFTINPDIFQIPQSNNSMYLYADFITEKDDTITFLEILRDHVSNILYLEKEYKNNYD